MTAKLVRLFFIFFFLLNLPAHALEMEVWQEYPGYLKKFRFYDVPSTTDSDTLKYMLNQQISGPGPSHKTYSANFYSSGKNAGDGPFAYVWRSGEQSGYRKIESREQKKNYEQPFTLGAEFLCHIYSSEPALAKRAFNGREVWLGGGGMLGEEVAAFEFNGDGLMLLTLAGSKTDTLKTYALIDADDPLVKKLEPGSRILLEGMMRGLIGTSILIDKAKLLDVRLPGQRLDR